jgi:hypothetical protein
MPHCLRISVLVLLACTFWGGTRTVQADESLSLTRPIECQLGVECWVVNLVDQDPGPGVLDFNCGAHTYDGHKGVDFAIGDLAVMDKGVPVLAAAPGIVKGVRNHMDDINIKKLKADVIEGLDCGNGLVIQHVDGWETQYCHMRRGSVRVVSGQYVKVGEALGFVGNSGRAEFPHLHLSVRHKGHVIDPFTAEAVVSNSGACDTGAVKRSLWDDPLVASAPDALTAIYALGFASQAIKPDMARSGQYRAATLSARSPALTLWADVFWVEGNDQIELKILDPKGDLFADHTVDIAREQARRFILFGKKRRSDPWPAGVYVGKVRLTRINKDGAIMEFNRTISVAVE